MEPEVVDETGADARSDPVLVSLRAHLQRARELWDEPPVRTFLHRGGADDPFALVSGAYDARNDTLHVNRAMLDHRRAQGMDYHRQLRYLLPHELGHRAHLRAAMGAGVWVQWVSANASALDALRQRDLDHTFNQVLDYAIDAELARRGIEKEASLQDFAESVGAVEGAAPPPTLAVRELLSAIALHDFGAPREVAWVRGSFLDGLRAADREGLWDQMVPLLGRLHLFLPGTFRSVLPTVVMALQPGLHLRPIEVECKRLPYIPAIWDRPKVELFEVFVAEPPMQGTNAQTTFAPSVAGLSRR